MTRTLPNLPHALTALLLFYAAPAALLRAEQTETLRITWANPDHPSGIYYPNGNATVTILIENPTADPLPLAGTIAFGPHTDNPKDFKPLSVTPITPATLAAGERATVNLTLQFANVGAYDLRFTPPPPHQLHPPPKSHRRHPRMHLRPARRRRNPLARATPQTSRRHPQLSPRSHRANRRPPLSPR